MARHRSYPRMRADTDLLRGHESWNHRSPFESCRHWPDHRQSPWHSAPRSRRGLVIAIEDLLHRRRFANDARIVRVLEPGDLPADAPSRARVDLPGRQLSQRDAILNRANHDAQIAADAFLIDHLEVALP